MNISATNLSHVQARPAFGQEAQIDLDELSIEDAEKIVKLSEQLGDSFKKSEKPKVKSAGGVLASVLGTVLATFVIGKCAASKVMTAFPSISGKVNSGLKKGADAVKNYADDLVKGGKNSKAIGEGINKAEKFAREAFIKLRDKSGGADKLLTNAVGIASVAAVAPEIMKVDGNEDGISDIAQKNISAYKNALHSVGIVSELIDSLS